MAILKLNNNSLTNVSELPSGVGSDPNTKISLARLGLRVFANQNLATSNTQNLSYDVFQDSTGIQNLTGANRNTNEFITTSSGSLGSFSLNTSDRGSEGIVLSLSGFLFGGTSTNMDNVWFDGAVNYDSSAPDEDWWFNPNSQTVTSSFIIHMDFGSSYNKVQNGFRLYLSNNSNCGTWKYQGSNDNTNFTDLLSSFAWEPNGGSSGSWYKDSTFSNTDKYRYFRFLGISGTTSNNPYQISAMFQEADDNRVINATGSFEGVDVTAPSSVSKMGAVITYEETGTNVLNTDLVMKLSADSGSNFTTATLEALPDFASGVKCAKISDVSVSPGTACTYQLNFANQSAVKEAKITGVALTF